MLLAVEPPEVLMRLKPTIDDRRRVLAAAAHLGGAKKMTVTSKAGTNLECDLGEFPVLTEYGFADQPGRWDHWPSGFLATWPSEQTARGTIVIDRGDTIAVQILRAGADPFYMRTAMFRAWKAASTPNS